MSRRRKIALFLLIGVWRLRAAGGAVSRPDGGPWTLRARKVLASNAPLHDRLAAITQKALDGAGE